MPEVKQVTPEEVHHMALLSRLEISADEEMLFARQFGEILGHMSILASVDTNNIEPLYNPLDHPCPVREDKPQNRRTQAEILANAPETDGESFMVPRIV